MSKCLPLATAALLGIAGLIVSPSSALAFQYEHHYCANNLAPGGTCPPNGSSEWAHLELNEADAGGQSHETCVDEYESNKGGFTGPNCMYYAGEEAHEYPGGEYGYPRAWNGGTVTHAVYATEYGYHTGAASLLTPSLSSSNTTANPLPTAVVEGLSNEPGMSATTARFAGGTYSTWVVSGVGETCLIVSATQPGDVPGGVCGTTAAAEENGLAMTRESASGTPVVVGLAPAGNSTVTVTNSDGTSESTPVSNGIYEVTSGTPTSVKLKAATGMTSRHLPALSRPAASAPAGSPTP